VRQYKIRAVGERNTQRARNLARAWTSAFERIPQPERRLNGVLSLARSLADAHNAIIFDEDRVIAGVPGGAAGEKNRRLFERARRSLEDELVTSELYVARLAPKRSERVALHWREAGAGSLEVARAIASSCAWALDLHLAEGDPPVGLPDASATFERLEQLVHGARRTKRSFAVVYVEVEAPASGKLVREAIARSLRRDVRAHDHVGHLGGETYLALVSIETSEAEADIAARRLLHAATGAAGDVCANVGVAVCPADGTQPEDLVEKASAAAMAAASVGSPVPYWYRESAGRQLHERALLRARLCDGDPATLLELRYQPIFDARSGSPCAVSAVTTWRGAQPPGTLEPLRQLDGETDRSARETLERWTIARAAEAQRAWREAGLELRMHLTIGEPTDPALEAIAAAFGSGSALRQLWVELTARSSEPAPGLTAFARRLRALGAGVGVGAWRLSSPPIDAASGLIDFVTVDARGDLGTLAALALGSVVAPVVIAEGVPDLGRARWVMRHGATAVRGDGLAAPLAMEELAGWMEDRRSLDP
jgi:EAL domain-containing protein (putative c-di-GMP-specific phosphodiesterase class I)/GGDEF domain-containing protein